jgi:hypothetical protein
MKIFFILLKNILCQTLLNLVSMFYKTVAIWLCQTVFPHIPVKYKDYTFLYVFAKLFLKEHQDLTLSIGLSSNYFVQKTI